MEKKKVITISRTYGSGGREIGEKLAKELGIAFYDKNLLLKISERTGISPEGLENADEKLLDRFVDSYAIGSGKSYSTNVYLYKIEKKLIEELAEKESCVIVGRLADWILKDIPDVMKVYLSAPEEDRVVRIMEKEGIGEKQARKLMKEVDKQREQYHSYFTEGKWKSMSGRDVYLNTSFKGVDGTVAILKNIAKMDEE